VALGHSDLQGWQKVGIDQGFDEVEDVFDGNLIIKWMLIRLMVRFKYVEDVFHGFS